MVFDFREMLEHMTDPNSVPLREHLAALREADLRAVAVALDNVAKQRAEDQHRDEQYRAMQNEWRSESKDRQNTYMTVAAFEQFQRNQTGDRFNGRTDIRGTVTMIAALGAIALTIILNLIR